MDFAAVKETLTPWLENRYLQALGILLASLVAAQVTDFILTRVIRKAAQKTRTDVDDQIIDMLHRPIFVSVVLIGIGLATTKLELSPAFHLSIFNILQSIAIILWVLVAMRITALVLRVVSRLDDRFQFVDRATLQLFDNLAKLILFGGAVYFVFLSWNIDVSAWLASAGIIGLAVGFAAKDSLANLFGGVFILADKPYEVGNYINLDTGERGEVTHIGLRTTRLLTRDDIEITIPNAVIAQAKIINETGGRWPKERIRVKVGVAYGSDIDLAEATLLELAIAHPDVCTDPEPRVRFRSFGESGLDFELLAWIVEPVHRGRVLHELNSSIYKAFAAASIEIPYPKRDVYLHTVPADTDSAG